eukprot:COSAG02_NODE_72131_length_187_cov_126.534091_1_plen_30_part_01
MPVRARLQDNDVLETTQVLCGSHLSDRGTR